MKISKLKKSTKEKMLYRGTRFFLVNYDGEDFIFFDEKDVKKNKEKMNILHFYSCRFCFLFGGDEEISSLEEIRITNNPIVVDYVVPHWFIS